MKICVVVVMVMGVFVADVISATEFNSSEPPLGYVLRSSGTMNVEDGKKRLIIKNGTTIIYDGEYADQELMEVVIPESVVSIGDEAFYANKLEKVIIPHSVTTLGEGVFAMNPLIELTFGTSIQTIGRWAFFGNKITTVTLSKELYDTLSSSQSLYSILGWGVETYQDFDGTVLN